MKRTLPTLAIPILFFLPVVTTAQKSSRKTARPAPAAAQAVEPLRVASGLMTENRIAVRRSDWINDGAPPFEYTLAGVVLAHRDNERGNEINQALCRVVRAMKTGADATELLIKLNHLLSR